MFLVEPTKKKTLENILKESYIVNGRNSIKIFENLKNLGFLYSTLSGISIGYNDFQTDFNKNLLLKKSFNYYNFIINNWQKGLFSKHELFVKIIKVWEKTSDLLKNNIELYYKQINTFNSLNLMVVSGARGNWSQIHQISNMRGLLVDQYGNLIETPVFSSLKEGLSLADYLISSYGARKGSIDTALKTADAGYLTRRLVFLVQNLIIKSRNCKTEFTLLLNNNNNISYIKQYLFSNLFNSFFFNKFYFSGAKSIICCESLICQKCYGIDFSKNKLIKLGTTIGILSAQSMGEPGTQMTLKTFHSGGAFSGENIKKLKLNTGQYKLFSCNIGVKSKNSINNTAILLNNNIHFINFNWKGLKLTNNLKKNTLLQINKDGFITKFENFIDNINLNNFELKLKIKNLLNFNSGIINIKNSIIKVFFSNILSIKKFVKKEGSLNILNANQIIKENINKSNFLNKFLYNNLCIEFYIITNKTKYYDINYKVQNKLLIYLNYFLFNKIKKNYYLDLGSINLLNCFNFKSNQKIKEIINYKDNLSSEFLLKKKIKHNYFDNYRNVFMKRKYLINFNLSTKLVQKSILLYNNNNYININNNLGYFIEESNKNEDIIEGLPKINALVELHDTINNNDIGLITLPNFNIENENFVQNLSNNTIKTLLNIKNFENYDKTINHFNNFCNDSLFINENRIKNGNNFKDTLTNNNSIMIKINKNGELINILDILKKKLMTLKEISYLIFYYHDKKDGNTLGLKNSIKKIQIMLTNSLASIYDSQDITIASKNIESIVQELTLKIKLLGYSFLKKNKNDIDNDKAKSYNENIYNNQYYNINISANINKKFVITPKKKIKEINNHKIKYNNNIIFFKKNIIDLKENFNILHLYHKYQNWIRKRINFIILKFSLYSLYSEKTLNINKLKYFLFAFYNKYKTKIKGIFTLSGASELLLQKNNFLENASFSKSNKILASAAIYGNNNWLLNIRETVLLAHKGIAGSNFIKSKEAFNNIYYYKYNNNKANDES